MNHARIIPSVGIATLAVAAFFAAGCKETKDDAQSKVRGIAASVKEGTPAAEIVKRFGEPDSKEANEQAKTENSEVWRYKKINQFYELQIRFVNGKTTWAIEQDRSAQKFTG